jgi:hypothetical protein
MDHQRVEGPTSTCPFCPFSDPDSNFAMEHIELCHPESNKDFDIDDCKEVTSSKQAILNSQQCSSGADENTRKYIDCPHGCGDLILANELSARLDLHFAEEFAYENASSSQLESSKSLNAEGLRRLHICDDLNNAQDQHGPTLKGRLKSERYTHERRPHSPSKIVPTGGVRRLGVNFYSFLLHFLSRCANF